MGPMSAVGTKTYDNIKRAITTLRLPPGHRLVEADLVQMTGVSRNTVREALQRLEGDGLIVATGLGRRVAPLPGPDAIDELYEVRTCMEVISVKRFVQNASDAEIADLGRAVDAFQVAQDVDGMLEAKDHLYELLTKYSPTVRQVLSNLHDRIAAARRVSLSESHRRGDSTAELRAMVAAIESKDVDKAADFASRHASAARAAVKGALAANPLYMSGVLGS